jgi:protocatechuate 3,4-dioxygenase beta subunit
MKNLLALLFLVSTSGVAQTDRPVGGACDRCNLIYDGMPNTMTWQTTLANNEPGEPMVIEGTIYKNDGKTPAPNVILYVYHTDAKGYYSNIPGQKEIVHGHLRGWMKTGADGKYKFTSIRPAPYPERNNPAHVHPLIKEEGLTVYWIDEYLFDDDPLVTEAVRKREQKRGGNGIIHLTKKDGVWHGARNITLGLNIPSYNR